jgi:hypothetical protein
MDGLPKCALCRWCNFKFFPDLLSVGADGAEEAAQESPPLYSLHPELLPQLAGSLVNLLATYQVALPLKGPLSPSLPLP